MSALAFACSAASNQSAPAGSGGAASGSSGTSAGAGLAGTAGASGGSAGTSAGSGDTAGGNAGMPSSAGAAGSGNSGGAGSAGLSGGAGSAGTPGNSGAGSGGAAGTSGTAGAAGSAGSSGGAGGSNGSPCSAPGLLFCDDFEARALGSTFSAPWSTTLIGGSSSTITIDDSVPAHSGTHSVRTHPADDAYQTLLVYHDAAVLPVTSGRFYMRAEIRFATPMTGGHNTFLMANLFATPDQGMVTRVGEDNQMLMMTIGGDAHGYLSNQMFWQNMQPGVQFQAGSWVCFEMMFDSPNTAFDVWVDGKEVPDMHVTDLAHDNYDSLRFGFEKYAGPVTDIWWDDIAIGTQQIGCP